MLRMTVWKPARDAGFSGFSPASRSKNQLIRTKPARDARFQAVFPASRHKRPAVREIRAKRGRE